MRTYNYSNEARAFLQRASDLVFGENHTGAWNWKQWLFLLWEEDASLVKGLPGSSLDHAMTYQNLSWEGNSSAGFISPGDLSRYAATRAATLRKSQIELEDVAVVILAGTGCKNNLAIFIDETLEYHDYGRGPADLERSGITNYKAPVQEGLGYEEIPNKRTVCLDNANREKTREFLIHVAANHAVQSGIRFDEDYLDRLLDLMERYLPVSISRQKSAAILDRCIVRVCNQGRFNVNCDDADHTMAELFGVPDSLAAGLAFLKQCLQRKTVLTKREINWLVDELNNSLNKPKVRPRTVAFLSGAAAGHARSIAGVIAKYLYGSRQRVVVTDFQLEEDIPWQVLRKNPFCVWLWQNADCCAPAILNILGQGIEDGCLLGAGARPVYLNDMIVLMAAPRRLSLKTKRPKVVGKYDRTGVAPHYSAYMAVCLNSFADIHLQGRMSFVTFLYNICSQVVCSSRLF